MSRNRPLRDTDMLGSTRIQRRTGRTLNCPRRAAPALFVPGALLSVVAACGSHDAAVRVSIQDVAPLMVSDVAEVECPAAARAWAYLYHRADLSDVEAAARRLQGIGPPFRWPSGRMRSTIVFDPTTGALTETWEFVEGAWGPDVTFTVLPYRPADTSDDQSATGTLSGWCGTMVSGGSTLSSWTQLVADDEGFVVSTAGLAESAQFDACPPAEGSAGRADAVLRSETALVRRGDCVELSGRQLGTRDWRGTACRSGDNAVEMTLEQTDAGGTMHAAGDHASWTVQVADWVFLGERYAVEERHSVDGAVVTVERRRSRDGEWEAPVTSRYQIGTAGVPVELVVMEDGQQPSRTEWVYRCVE